MQCASETVTKLQARKPTTWVAFAEQVLSGLCVQCVEGPWLLAKGLEPGESRGLGFGLLGPLLFTVWVLAAPLL